MIYLFLSVQTKSSKIIVVGCLTQEMIIRLSLILKSKTAIRNMVQILQPFKEGYSHTTSINVQIRDDQDVTI